jgi:hypothetical protein
MGVRRPILGRRGCEKPVDEGCSFPTVALCHFELDPKVPTHETRTWETMNRKRRGVHELLVGPHEPERPKVSSNSCNVVDARERTCGTIGVGMDEPLHAKVSAQSFTLRNPKVSTDEAPTNEAAERPECKDYSSPNKVDCHEIVEGTPSVEHRNEAASRT